MSGIIKPGEYGFAMPGEDPRVNVQRADGRPEAYDLPVLPDSQGYLCTACANTENHAKLYPSGQIVMVSPIDTADGTHNFCCLAHLPDNVVIYDPVSNLCRDKTGQNVWREGGDVQ